MKQNIINGKLMKEKGKRYIKVPIGMCKPMSELTSKEHIEYVGFYSKEIDNREYISDIIQTASKNYYVRIIDVTDGYEEIDLNVFKEKYGQPTLFDYFDI